MRRHVKKNLIKNETLKLQFCLDRLEVFKKKKSQV